MIEKIFTKIFQILFMYLLFSIATAFMLGSLCILISWIEEWTNSAWVYFGAGGACTMCLLLIVLALTGAFRLWN